MEKPLDVNDLSFDVVLPTAILLNKNLEPNCIKLYAFIKGLTRVQGYCFATNGYLAKLMDSDESSIKRWMLSLKKEGFIEINTIKEGVYWYRHIYLATDLNKCLRRANFELPPAEKRAGAGSEMSYIIEKKNNREKEEEERPSAIPIQTSAPKKQTKIKEVLKERATRVLISDSQNLELIKKAGNQEIVDRCYDKLSIWKVGKCIEGGSDFKSITNWVLSAVKQEMNKPAPVDLATKNQQFALKIVEKFRKHPKISLGHKYIEFDFGMNVVNIPFTDHGFEEQCLNALRRMKLDVGILG